MSAKRTLVPAGGAFTKKYESKVVVLRTEIDVREPLRFTVVHADQKLSFQAIWDTGASSTAISQNVVRKLGLKPTGMKRTVHTGNGTRQSDVYAVSLHLPQGVITDPILAIDVESIVDADVLVGMDVIGMGDFAVTHSDGNTSMSFCIPSMHDTNYNETMRRRIAHQNKAQSRNQPKHTPPR